MASFIIMHVHAVFSTKSKESLIVPEIENKLHRYISGIGRNKGFPVLKSGGMSDHIHVLFLLPANMRICDAIRYIKGSSSKWINDNFYDDRRFKWQGGYSAFAVSISQAERVKTYIQNQKKHHKNYDFDDELKLFQKIHREKMRLGKAEF